MGEYRQIIARAVCRRQTSQEANSVRGERRTLKACHNAAQTVFYGHDFRNYRDHSGRRAAD
jgi:hypothetical protein